MRRGELETWMWGEAFALLQRAERLRRQFYIPAAEQTEGWEPPIDIYETDSDVWLLVALPGVNPEEVKAFVEGDILTITGRRTLPAVARTGKIRRVEIPQGHFTRRVGLPSTSCHIEHRGIENGCLLLRIAKAR